MRIFTYDWSQSPWDGHRDIFNPNGIQALQIGDLKLQLPNALYQFHLRQFAKLVLNEKLNNIDFYESSKTSCINICYNFVIRNTDMMIVVDFIKEKTKDLVSLVLMISKLIFSIINLKKMLTIITINNFTKCVDKINFLSK